MTRIYNRYKVSKTGKIYKKLHKWPGLVIAFLLLYYGITGILMNHREFIAAHDVNRNSLPKEYHFKHWNNSSLKGNLIINPDSILIYGDLGIYVTDSAFTKYRPMDKGLPKGTDNRKFELSH